MTDLPKLEGALTAVMSRGDLEAFTAQNFEASVGDILKSESAGEIPGVGLILSLVRDHIAVRDYLFQKKLFVFLATMSSIPKDERAALVQKLEIDADYGRKVGQHLIELLDRIESHKKPRMLARVFLAYSAGEIDATMLHRLVYAVEQLPAFEIASLRQFCEGTPVERKAHITTRQVLMTAGLLVAASTFGGPSYNPTPVAMEFLRLELDRLE